MAQDAKPDLGQVLTRVEAALAATSGDGGQQHVAMRSQDLAMFARLLLESAGAEAIAGYDPQTLAAFVREAFTFVAVKPEARSSVLVRASDLPAGAQTRRVATVQTLNDDMPFLVDSVIGEIRAQGLAPLLVVHPIFKVRRDQSGRLVEITGPGDRNWSDGRQESYIAAVLDPLDVMVAQQLETTLPVVLREVRAAVSDWSSMLERLDTVIARLQQADSLRAGGSIAEAITFCRWLRDGNFTLLGLREHGHGGSGSDLVAMHGSGLGILREDLPGQAPLPIPSSPVTISKSAEVSHVHRRVALDRVVIAVSAADGTPAGAVEVVGLLTSSAYTQSPATIPMLRQKVAAVVLRSGHPPESHDGKVLINVLETFPRDELFQIGEDLLGDWAEAILDLELRPRVRLLVRAEPAAATVSALVYIPRDRFSTAVRERIGMLLAEAWAGRIISFTPFFPEGPLVRVHFVLAASPRGVVDAALLETRITALTRTWEDQLADALVALGDIAPALSAKYRYAFTAGYQEQFSSQRALEDIGRIERLGPARTVAIDFYRASGQPANRLHAAVYRFDTPIPLSERVPLLENFGFSVIDERSYRLMPRFQDGVREVSLHDMVLEVADGAATDLAAADGRLEACFLAVFAREADNDAFNRLVLAAGADWREAALMRAYAAYMRQIRSPFTLRYIAETLARHRETTRDLIALFMTRFDPDLALDQAARTAAEVAIKQRVEAALTSVASLDEDRILRQIAGLIAASVRTNYFQRTVDGAPPDLITFKLDSRQIDGLPEPRPYREIWVYGPRVEGVHLRFSPVARGGIRWSDRAQDFRTEVLGLCKAQQVKNAVIVPNGAKGGFLPKQLPKGGGRDEIAREGIAAYKLFIGALLDLTDNLDTSAAVVPPARVIRHDGDDPYLVVAADKGTATFSDTANAIATARGFWLGDAFASGGSAGYDHKRMGITARGAWECVKRHFREMDRDIQTSPFTVAGVGDMSGDVFGNGMLLSPATRLVAAFDHRDIFIDPDPDPVRGLAERQRLFELPRSSWQDYDKSLISEGGGVFPRAAKSIAVSSSMRTLLGIVEPSVAPVELIRAILRARVDLIWLGGIGTYIKAGDESDEAVGDRANDAVRVTAAEVEAKVIGEGANLGVTQRGRIELARKGCRIDTDFIDNSAGVNTSDQEVNIKIALAPAVAGGLDETGRLALLASMTDDVGAGSLRNNYQQSLALSLAEERGAEDLGYLQRLMQVLEGKGLLDRRLEALPGNAELAQRQAAGRGLVRPELAVLLSFAKIALTHELLATGVPDEPKLHAMLLDYFPRAIRDRFPGGIEQHRLRREIVTTILTNGMINRGGPAFTVRMSDETGRSVADVAHGFLSARQALGLPEIWRQIDALDGKVSGALQLSLYARVQEVLLATTRWFVRHGEGAAVSETDVADTVAAIRAHALDAIVTPGQARRFAAEAGVLAAGGVPEPLRDTLASLHVVAEAPAIAQLAKEATCGFDCAAPALFKAEEQLRLGDLEARAAEIAIRDHYDRLAIDGALAAVRTAAERIARRSLQRPDAAGTDVEMERARFVVDEILANGALTASRLTVAAQRVRDLMGG